MVAAASWITGFRPGPSKIYKNQPDRISNVHDYQSEATINWSDKTLVLDTRNKNKWKGERKSAHVRQSAAAVDRRRQRNPFTKILPTVTTSHPQTRHEVVCINFWRNDEQILHSTTARRNKLQCSVAHN
jgi:hypothetical protein